QAPVIPTDASGGPAFGAFSSVSCPASNLCLAAGRATYPSLSDDRPLAERWDGSTWALLPTPPTPADESNPGRLPVSWGFQGVSCTAGSACTAVGSYPNATGRSAFAERWNGTSWVLQIMPAPPNDTELAGVSCPSTSACTAVGLYNPGLEVTLAEHWDGVAWVIQ